MPNLSIAFPNAPILLQLTIKRKLSTEMKIIQYYNIINNYTEYCIDDDVLPSLVAKRDNPELMLN
jgi:hypothetical protein